MKHIVVISFAAFALFITSCADAAQPINISRSSTPAPPVQKPGVDSHGHTEGSDAPRISLADAKKAFDAKSAIFIDTHVKATYDAGHIPGAMNITMQDFEAKFDSIPKGKRIIAYCS